MKTRLSHSSRAWSVLWRSRNRLDGLSEHLCHENLLPVLFKTRRAARQWIAENYAELGTRRDLRREPHGYRVPRAVRVKISVEDKP